MSFDLPVCEVDMSSSRPSAWVLCELGQVCVERLNSPWKELVEVPPGDGRDLVVGSEATGTCGVAGEQCRVFGTLARSQQESRVAHELQRTVGTLAGLFQQLACGCPVGSLPRF